MGGPRHKLDTRTFAALTFPEQARSISAQIVNLERAVRRHAPDSNAPTTTRRKIVDQVERLRNRASRVWIDTMMPRPVAVKPLTNFRIWLRYDDGAEGELDLSDLAGKGVFQAWNDFSFFSSVRIGARGAIEWPNEIDLCPDAVYLRLTGKAPDQLFPALRSTPVDA